MTTGMLKKLRTGASYQVVAMGTIAVVSGLLGACAPTVTTRLDIAAAQSTAIRETGAAIRGKPQMERAADFMQSGLKTKDRALAAQQFVEAARIAWDSLRKDRDIPADQWLDDPQTREAALLYNAACLAFFTREGPALTSGEPVRLPDGSTLPVVYRTRPGFGPGYFDALVTASSVKVKGFKTRSISPGMGTALVGERFHAPGREKELAHQPPLSGVMIPLNGSILFPDGRPEVCITGLTHSNTVNFHGRKIPLAGDFTATVALSLNNTNDLRLGLLGLFNPGALSHLADIYLLEPFDPDRTPVLMVHGLGSSPLIWRGMIAGLMRHAEIRENYQFWVAYYPSGMPIPQSMAFLRDRVGELRRAYDPDLSSRAARSMVTVGHSMGAVINRANMVSIGNRLWDEVSTKRLDEIELPEEERKLVERLAFWEPIPGIQRGIYIAGPHRGATLADSSLANIGMSLIRLPGRALRIQADLLQRFGEYLKGDARKFRFANSISTLSPSYPLYAALDQSPSAPGYKFHSIIGDRGHGDTPDSSDGVVGYWSSHLAGAESELVIPARHADAFEIPPAHEEVRRILMVNLGLRSGIRPAPGIYWISPGKGP